MKRVLIYMAMLSLVLFNCSKKTTTNNYYTSPNEGAIVGIVYPPESQAKVTAYLAIPAASTQIDTNGYYKLSGLPVGTYSLLVKADGYNDYSPKAKVNVTREATVLMDTIFLSSIHDLILEVNPNNGAKEVRIYQTIRIVFRKAMDMESVKKAFHLQPEVPGDFEWYEWSSESNYGWGELEFVPQDRFMVNTQYQVTIDSTASDTAGIKLSQPYQFSFTTEDVQITYTNPRSNDNWVRPNTSISISFNSNMNVESVNSAFKMVDSQLHEVKGSFYWYYSNELYFNPDSSLLTREVYTVTIDTTASDSRGSKLPSTYEFSFVTQPVLIYNSYPNNKETWVDTSAKVVIYFNTDMDMETTDSAFRMTDSELRVITGQFVWHYQWQLEFDPDSSLTPNETYTVTIDSTAKEIHGNKLEKPYSFWFKIHSY